MADTALIEGAYSAAGGGEGDLSAVKGMTKIADTIAKPIAIELNNRRKNFKDFAEWEISRQPGLNDAEFEQKYEQLMEMKSQFIWGDNMSRAKIMRHMGAMKIQQDKMDAAKAKFAADALDKENGTAGNKKWIQSNEAQTLIGALSLAPQDTNGDGIADAWVGTDGTSWTAQELEDKSTQKSFDRNSKTTITAFRDKIREDSKNTGSAGYFAPFDWDGQLENVKTNFVNKGTFESLVYDTHFGDTSFYEDLQSALMQGNYKDLGIDPDSAAALEDMDPTPDDTGWTTTEGNVIGNISANDAKVIVDKLIEMDSKGQPLNDLGIEYVAKYFTGYLQNNWNQAQNAKNAYQWGEVTVDPNNPNAGTLMSTLKSNTYDPNEFASE